jgi:hypothetical protein
MRSLLSLFLRLSALLKGRWKILRGIWLGKGRRVFEDF